MKLFEKRPSKNDLIKDIFATGSVIYKLSRHHKTLDLESAIKKVSKWFIRNHLTITILLTCHKRVEFRHRQQTRNRLGGIEGNIVLCKFISKCI